MQTEEEEGGSFSFICLMVFNLISVGVGIYSL